MGHRCGATCKRKTGERCDTCRVNGGRKPARAAPVEVVKRERSETHHATPMMVGAAVDMYFDGLSYRRVAENVQSYFGRKTNPATVFRWVHSLSDKATAVTHSISVPTSDEWVADELAVRVGGKQYWLFNVMDSKTRFVLAAYLSPDRSARAAATALAQARKRSATIPKRIKTDGLPSYGEGVFRAFGATHSVEHVVSKGIRAEINNNLSERLQGTLRDRDKTLRGLESRETGQTYVDGLVMNYNFFRPHEGLDGKTPAQATGAPIPFASWREVASADED